MSTIQLQFAGADGSAQSKAIAEDPVGFGLNGEGQPEFLEMPEASATLTATRHGIWLHVSGERNSVHLNGRPVRKLAWIRAGDRIFLDGQAFFVVGEATPVAGEPETQACPDGLPAYSLRGLSAEHFGQAIPVGSSLRVGTDAQSDLRLAGGNSPMAIASLSPVAQGVQFNVVTDAYTSQVNGKHASTGVLTAGDQWVLGGRHRFVLESPGFAAFGGAARFDDESENLLSAALDEAKLDERRQLMSRLSWVILICALISVIVTALIVYGPR